MNKYTRYTKELLEPIVASSQTYADCLRQLGLKAIGSNFKTIRQKIEEFGLDSSHMLHQGHYRGREVSKFEDLKSPKAIKNRLIKLRGNCCESCKLVSWFETPIPLEIHHIDGRSRNNTCNNLQLLCPNCHASTDTWRKRYSSR